MHCVAVAAAAAALALALAGPASARSFTIVARGSADTRGTVVRIGDFRVARDPRLRAAIGAFGAPSSRRAASGFNGCRVSWRRLGIKIVFANFGAGGSACKPRFGRAQDAIVNTRRWRTRRGLRVRDRVRRIGRLYPNALHSGRFYKLVTGRNVFGTGRGRYAVVGARTIAGRVRALTMNIGAAGE